MFRATWMGVLLAGTAFATPARSEGDSPIFADARIGTVPASAKTGAVPRSLERHPGNIFLAGEEVSIELPADSAESWQVVDVDGQKVMEGRGGNRAGLGRLPVGYYELRRQNKAPISMGVVAQLNSPTNARSPISADVAMAWFYPEAKMPAVANLCALAGLNWVRDRLNWAEVEREQGKFLTAGRYDASAAAQSGAGLRVLQVNHVTPGWANPDRKRFPPDLRDAYRFHQEMARRWRGQVAAFEPWNEADIVQFGGHTGAEIASFQKASYLGLKAGNPDVLVCQNVFAVVRKAILEDFHENRAWPYFETFNLHHYAPVDKYAPIYAEFRAVSAGRPLWVTECSMPVKWAGDPNRQEPTEADLRVQAQRVAPVFAGSLHEGSAATFYFLVPHYVEGQTQFGILRPDLTPRPAYLALAAVGRLLADARGLGRWKNQADQVRALMFAARPDGRERAVLVAWTSGGRESLELPAEPAEVFDHLGRGVAVKGRGVEISPSPLFVLMPLEAQGKFDLERPPAAPPLLEGTPVPTVLQSIWPKERVALDRSAYRVSVEKPERIPVFIYNFGAEPAEGRLSATAPAGVKAELPGPLSVSPGQRREAQLTLDLGGVAPGSCQTVQVRGDFGAAGQAVLSLRLIGERATAAKP